MADVQLYFGWRTALLGAAILQLLVLAALLVRAEGVRAANRLLAALLIVIAGLLTPYAIGFAGFYDAWRWLTFLPVAIPLAVGPLLWAYAETLDDGRLPERPGLHLIPPALQFTYQFLCFLLPMGAKWAWYTGVNQRWVAPFTDVAVLVSLAAYAWAVARVLRRRAVRLAEARSDDDRFAAGWLKAVLGALIAGLVLHVGFAAWSWMAGGIDFFQQTGLYLGLGVIGLWLGIAGWRHAALPPPLMPRRREEPVAENKAQTDWAALGREVDRRLRQEEWWREPDLTLAVLARRMGTNDGRLSRAINLGLGVNFSVFVNGVRAEAVAEAMRERPRADLLDLAFEMGFASKASFNRAFRARFGTAPSQWRRRVSDSDYSRPIPEMRRGEAARRAG